MKNGYDMQTSMVFGYENGAHATLSCSMVASNIFSFIICGDFMQKENFKIYLESSFSIK